MANLLSEDIVNLFNTIVRSNANRDIVWGKDHYPPLGERGSVAANVQAFYNNVFTGSVDGLNVEVDNSAMVGLADVEEVRNEILKAASAYTAIRRVQVYMRYRSSKNGTNSYSTLVNITKVGHLNDDYKKTVPAPSTTNNLQPGQPASLLAMENHMRAISRAVETIRNDVVKITETFCHSSCHNDCHSSCVTAPPPKECTNPSTIEDQYAVYRRSITRVTRGVTKLSRPAPYDNTTKQVRGTNLRSDFPTSSVSGKTPHARKVIEWYLDYLGRGAEPIGMRYWVGFLEEGRPESEVEDYFRQRAGQETGRVGRTIRELSLCDVKDLYKRKYGSDLAYGTYTVEYWLDRGYRFDSGADMGYDPRDENDPGVPFGT